VDHPQYDKVNRRDGRCSTNELGHEVYHTESPPRYIAGSARGSSSRGSICDGEYMSCLSLVKVKSKRSVAVTN